MRKDPKLNSTKMINNDISDEIDNACSAKKSYSRFRTFPSYRARLRDLKFPNSIDIFLPIPSHDIEDPQGNGDNEYSTPFKTKFLKQRSQSYANLNPKYLLENLLKEKNVT